MSDQNHIKVWDIATRIFHWSLVVFFALAWITGEALETLHAWAGYVVLGLILFRIVWGLIGSKYARFWNFIYSPAVTMSYTRALLSGKAQHYLGHNPLGGWMVVLLLLFLCLTVWSGLEAYAATGKGPLATDSHFIQYVYADDARHESRGGHDEFWEEVHEFFSNFTLLLVFLHVSGVIFSSYQHRENLVRAMLTGYKSNPPT